MATSTKTKSTEQKEFVSSKEGNYEEETDIKKIQTEMIMLKNIMLGMRTEMSSLKKVVVEMHKRLEVEQENNLFLEDMVKRLVNFVNAPYRDTPDIAIKPEEIFIKNAEKIPNIVKKSEEISTKNTKKVPESIESKTINHEKIAENAKSKPESAKKVPESAKKVPESTEMRSIDHKKIIENVKQR